jgi:HEAT repeat protein
MGLTVQKKANRRRRVHTVDAMGRAPAPHDYDGWVAQLGTSTRRQYAKRYLRTVGAPALPAIRRGVKHPKPMVRRLCVSILDQLVDDASLPDLVGALDDADPEVVRRALHALACEQCKQNECRPGDETFVPRALELLVTHPNPDIRAGAAQALARVAHRRDDVAEALVVAADRDGNAGVRNIARGRARAPVARA